MLAEECYKELAVVMLVFVIEHPGTPTSYRVIVQEGLIDIKAELPEDMLAVAKERGKDHQIEELLESTPDTPFNTPTD